MEFQIYAVNWRRDLWDILKAPIPCEAGQGELLRTVREKNLKKAISEEESKLKR